ncbi:hypothetical protein C8R34_105103 [Nitrosomonas sp. Nm84]|uniref:hypothetical protein n=1 Tax=Nitrosomonas sp. Nm84 TaxID=200124 RepID=UPI000D7542B5|nr:hypothetical protein [Nitrosomonas sp. Nm84]PXW89122.1 hypothetical protein C8R34_105103 [Nitrosomonas sp. Nm84]
MDDPRIISAIVSGVVALLIGGITSLLNLWRIRKEFKQADRRISEEIALELVKQRITYYEKLIADLRVISSKETQGQDVESLRTKVNKVVNSLQTHIFGRCGLIATHETRETILRLREKCIRFLSGRNTTSFEEIRKASWEVHQMLRSDLGLSQPNLLSAIDRLHSEELAGKESEIEELLAKIHHNDWKS